MSAYVHILDGYTFPRADVPVRGPIVEFSPQRWDEARVLGGVDPGSVLTFIGYESQHWDLVSRAITATKDKLLAVYAGRAIVAWTTPQSTPSTILVVMTRLEIQYTEPIESGKFLCSFTLVSR